MGHLKSRLKHPMVLSKSGTMGFQDANSLLHLCLSQTSKEATPLFLKQKEESAEITGFLFEMLRKTEQSMVLKATETLNKIKERREERRISWKRKVRGKRDQQRISWSSNTKRNEPGRINQQPTFARVGKLLSTYSSVNEPEKSLSFLSTHRGFF